MASHLCGCRALALHSGGNNNKGIINTMSPQDKKKKCISLTNELITSCNLLTPRITSFRDMHPALISSLFETVTGSRIRVKDPLSMYGGMISHLSHLLRDDLSYLDIDKLVDKDSEHIYYLMEILSAMHLYFTCTCEGTGRGGNRQSQDLTPFWCESYSLRTPSLPSSLGSSSCSCCSCYQCPREKSSSLSITPSSTNQTERDIRAASHRYNEKASNASKPHKLIDARSKREKMVQQQRRIRDSDRISFQPPRRTFVSSHLYDLRRAKERNFALELGYRLHHALRLEEDAQMIERKMNRLHQGIRSYDETIKRSTINSMMKRLGITEPIDRKIISKSQIIISDAVEREERRAGLIRREIDHLDSLRRQRLILHNRVNTNAVIRNRRTERVNINRMMKDLPSPILSGPGGDLQAVENRQNMIEVKAGLRELDQKERQQTRDLLEAYDNLYEGRRQLVRDRLQQEEEGMRQRCAHNRHMLSQIRQEMKNKHSL